MLISTTGYQDIFLVYFVNNIHFERFGISFSEECLDKISSGLSLVGE